MPGQVSAKKNLLVLPSASNVARRARGHLPSDSGLGCPMCQGRAGCGARCPQTPP